MDVETFRDLDVKMLSIANRAMAEEGFDLEDYQANVTEDSTTYTVKYALNDSTMLGGGGTIIISKETLKILSKRFEQ